MYLSRHRAAGGARWALDGHYLPQDFTLGQLLGVRATEIRSFVDGQALGEAAGDPSLPPVEPGHEIWASGVTYLRSREARELESTDADAYERVYDGSCSLGPGIVLSGSDSMRDLRITMSIRRGGESIFEDEIDTSQMKRSPEELAAFLGRELAFPRGAFLMTGTGIVPEDDFTLGPGDLVRISVGDLVLENEVA